MNENIPNLPCQMSSIIKYSWSVERTLRKAAGELNECKLKMKPEEHKD